MIARPPDDLLMAKAEGDEGSLKRLGGGRWQTRDGRFTIEPQSGTWVIVDSEQTDDLGLARVRGPYGSLRAAKEAIAGVRDQPPEASPLAGRMTGAPNRTKTEPRAKREVAGAPPTSRRGRRKPEPEEPEPSPEPAWLARLDEDRRRDARRLIRDLEAADLPDPIGLARRELEGDEPAVAQALVLRRLASTVLDRQAGDDKAGARATDLAVELVTWLTTRSRDPDAPLRLPGWRFVEEGGGERRIEITRRELVREIERLRKRSRDGPGQD